MTEKKMGRGGEEEEAMRKNKTKTKEVRKRKAEVLTFMRVVAVLSDTAAAAAAVQ